MAYEKKPGEAKLFKNKEKATESDADYQGYYLHEDGVTEEGINGWINTAASGEKYMKLSFWNKSKAAAKGIAQARQTMAPKPASQPQDIPEDDIPF